jgi:hypothetical protein
MAAKKVKHRAKKAASNKKPHAPKAAVRYRRMAAKGLALGPLDRPAESLVDAARRRWLSAEGSETSRVVSPPGSVPRLGTRVSH